MIGILVDFVLQGHGNSSSGNMSRRFFKNFQSSARILHLNPKLLENFKDILNNINSTSTVVAEDHFKLCCKANNLITNEYPSWKLSPTVHKVLVHSTYAIKIFGSTGMYSEEPFESSHKIFRQYRLHTQER